MYEQRETRVVALGNPLRGDDGVGAAVLRQLQTLALPPDVTLIDGGTAGLETALLLQGCRRAIIVDAAEMGLPPGAWARFASGECRLEAGDLSLRGTLHAAGLAEALALGEALDILPPAIEIFGIQPAAIGWTPGLSHPVEAAVPVVSRAIWRALHEAMTDDDSNHSGY